MDKTHFVDQVPD